MRSSILQSVYLNLKNSTNAINGIKTMSKPEHLQCHAACNIAPKIINHLPLMVKRYIERIDKDLYISP